MKVGDLVKRSPRAGVWWDLTTRRLGIVVALGYGGNPGHPTASVMYPDQGETYEIARSLLEVISEDR